VALFVILSAYNIALIATFLWLWGIASAEGMMMVLYGAMVVSDNCELLYHYLFSPDLLAYGTYEFTLRIHPTEVYILATLILMAGLLAGNPRRLSVSIALDDAGLTSVRERGVAIAIVGALLFLVGIALTGRSLFAAMNQTRTATNTFGGFWYRGSDTVLVGLALVFAATCRPNRVNYFPLITMFGVAFFLSANKGGIEKACFWAGVVLFVYNRSAFNGIVTVPRVVALMLLAYFGMGLKNMMLSEMFDHNMGTAWKRASVSGFLDEATGAAASGYGTRFSDQAGYRSFCQFIEGVDAYQIIYGGFRVGEYSITAWVPRLLYRDKPRHPFEGIGVITNFNLKDSSPFETEAPGWAGAAMADRGYYTLVSYLLVSGIFLGALRRLVALSYRQSLRDVYLVFVLFGGFSAETGILPIMDILAFALSVIGLSNLLLKLRDIAILLSRGQKPHLLQSDILAHDLHPTSDG
jgi:hypothetical protein